MPTALLYQEVQRPVGRQEAAPVVKRAPARYGPFWTVAWFGLLAGWLEWALVVGRGAVDSQVTREMIRRNRHYVWMMPIADLAVFLAAAAALLPLIWLAPRAARWLTFRLAVGLTSLTLLLNVEEIHPAASALLACGLGVEVGRWLSRRAERLTRWMVLSAPVLAGCMVPLGAWEYPQIASSAQRAQAVAPAVRPGTPNVLFIVLDDVRAASVGMYGCGRENSSNLERWAQRGIAYGQARSTAPWTLPSHASMFTGRWPHELSVAWDRPLDLTYPTLAEVLRGQGYATAGFVGNTYFCNAGFGLDRGFDRYEDLYENVAVSPFEIIRTSSVARRAFRAVGYPSQGNEWDTSQRKSAEMLNRDVLAWLDGQRDGAPFFVFINYYDAHAPFLPPEGPDPRYGMATLPLADRLAIDRRFVDWEAGKPLPEGYTPDRIQSEGLANYRDNYESCIAYLDRQVGILLDELHRQGILDNTLVVITSDHGEEFGGHGLVGHCLSLYSHEVHVPLIILPPARSWTSSTMQVVNEPVSVREIPATIAQAAGLGAKNPFPGGSLTRFLDAGSAQLPAQPVLSEVQHMKHIPVARQIPSSLGPVESILVEDRVYIRHSDGREEFYDFRNDPFELADLARLPESRTDLARFRGELDRSRGRAQRQQPGQPR